MGCILSISAYLSFANVPAKIFIWIIPIGKYFEFRRLYPLHVRQKIQIQTQIHLTFGFFSLIFRR